MRRVAWVGLAAVVLLSGCSQGQPAVGTCVSWADLSDPQDAYDAAEVVVIGTVEPASTTAPMFGVDAAVHDVAVVEVLKGDPPPREIQVVSTPVTCMGDEVYPDGDPLDVDGDVIIFIATGDADGAWNLISPSDAVLPVPADGTTPFETE